MLSNSLSLDWSTMGKLLHLDLMSMSMYWLAMPGSRGHKVREMLFQMYLLSEREDSLAT